MATKQTLTIVDHKMLGDCHYWDRESLEKNFTPDFMPHLFIGRFP